MGASMLGAATLNMAYSASGVKPLAYGVFALIAFCRPLFYTLAAAFTAEVFGMESFGKVYGLLFTLAGVANYLIQPLQMVAVVQGYDVANAILLSALFLSAALPIRV